MCLPPGLVRHEAAALLAAAASPVPPLRFEPVPSGGSSDEAVRWTVAEEDAARLERLVSMAQPTRAKGELKVTTHHAARTGRGARGGWCVHPDAPASQRRARACVAASSARRVLRRAR